MLRNECARTEHLKGSFWVWKRATGIFWGTTYCAFSVLSFELHTGAVPDLDPCLEQCLPSILSRVVQRHQDMAARITSSTPYPVHLHAQCDIKTCSISLTWKQWSIIEVYIDHTSSRPSVSYMHEYLLSRTASTWFSRTTRQLKTEAIWIISLPNCTPEPIHAFS